MGVSMQGKESRLGARRAPRRCGRSLAAAMAGALAALLLLPGSQARAEGDWQFSLTPYLWLAFIDIKADTSQGTIDTDASFDDVFTDLNFGFMMAGEAHNGTWGLLADLLYLSVTTEGDTPRGLLWDKAVVDTSGFIGSFYGEYRALNRQGLTLDLLAGMRLYTVTVDTELKGGAAPKVKDDVSDTWVDPVIGLRSRLKLDEDRFVGVSGDVGGFGAGSKLSYQVLGTVGWQFAEDWSVQAGYRYLSVNKDFDGEDIKFKFHGPIIGVSYRF
jgi:outer membrane receptor protein involved in Fe transport